MGVTLHADEDNNTWDGASVTSSDSGPPDLIESSEDFDSEVMSHWVNDASNGDEEVGVGHRYPFELEHVRVNHGHHQYHGMLPMQLLISGQAQVLTSSIRPYYHSVHITRIINLVVAQIARNLPVAQITRMPAVDCGDDVDHSGT